MLVLVGEVLLVMPVELVLSGVVSVPALVSSVTEVRRAVGLPNVASARAMKRTDAPNAVDEAVARHVLFL